MRGLKSGCGILLVRTALKCCVSFRILIRVFGRVRNRVPLSVSETSCAAACASPLLVGSKPVFVVISVFSSVSAMLSRPWGSMLASSLFISSPREGRDCSILLVSGTSDCSIAEFPA
jgi:hypothetical protein